MKRSLERTRVEREPYLVWNAFINVLAMEDYGDLTPLQRKAYLCFWYDSEVQNGGHGQYFENQGVKRLAETVAALTDLGLPCQAELLSKAAVALEPGGQEADWTEILEDDLVDKLDESFHECAPTITEGLERHLATYRDEYVLLT